MVIIMASTIIHLAVAKRVNEVLKLDEKDLFLGAISPDIAKIVGIPRSTTHFVTGSNLDLINMDLFLSKYKNSLNNTFELGYYIHLLTDELWFNEFISNFVNDHGITDKDGRLLELDPDTVKMMIYNDYTNLNREVLSYYNMDLSLFYEELDYPHSHIEEFKDEYFPILIEKMGIITQKLVDSNYFLDIASITHFIEYATIYCLDRIKELDI